MRPWPEQRKPWTGLDLRRRIRSSAAGLDLRRWVSIYSATRPLPLDLQSVLGAEAEWSRVTAIAVAAATEDDKEVLLQATLSPSSSSSSSSSLPPSHSGTHRVVERPSDVARTVCPPNAPGVALRRPNATSPVEFPSPVREEKREKRPGGRFAVAIQAQCRQP
jgi:hypothetical protein